MNLEWEFDKRIAAIHGLDHVRVGGRQIGGNTMDVRQAEFQAMADVFLGENFDQAKLKQVEDLQITLHNEQATLYQRYEAQEIGPDEYVELFNAMLVETFDKCEDVLGPENFIKLFGVPRSELAGFMDKEAFRQAHQLRNRR